VKRDMQGRVEPATVSEVRPRAMPFHRPMFDGRETAAAADVLTRDAHRTPHRAMGGYERAVSLPLYPAMSDDDAEYVVNAVGRALRVAK